MITNDNNNHNTNDSTLSYSFKRNIQTTAFSTTTALFFKQVPIKLKLDVKDTLFHI